MAPQAGWDEKKVYDKMKNKIYFIVKTPKWAWAAHRGGKKICALLRMSD